MTAASDHRGTVTNRLVTHRALVLALLAMLAVQQLLLWAFLGFAWWTYVVGAAGFAALIVLLRRTGGWDLGGGPSPAILAACLAVAIAACLLGGEGRFFYANTDWQVRDAVLRDLTVYPWPYVYQVTPSPLILRAPLGMYLVPALIGKALGYRAAELALLGQNSLLLATLLAIGSALFRDTRSRLIGLIVFLGFSGMDILGATIMGKPVTGHLENWIGLQYSSNVTLIFWVPQHGMAGWIGALLYMLWRDDRVPRAAFLAALPLLALMSPLALMGLMPFAAHAGFDGLLKRRLIAADIALPALALALAVPSLLYLAVASETVGERAEHMSLYAYLLFEQIEVLPYLAAVWLAGRHRFGLSTLCVITAVLLLVPFGKIGPSSDFVMRASIPALAVLAVLAADILAGATADRNDGATRIVVGLTFAIGLFTPAAEIIRALTLPVSPTPLCSFLGAVPGGAATYDAPLSRVSPIIRPARPTFVRPNDPARCWNGPWPQVIQTA